MGNAFEYEIDFMREEDVNEVMRVERASFATPWTKAMFMEEIKRQGRSYSLVARVARQNEPNGQDKDRKDRKVVGYIMTWIIVDEAHIINIAVDPKHRRKGIAKALMSKTLDYAKSMNVKRATLEVRVSNIEAQKLYEKFGFKKVAIRRRFYPDNHEDAYIMCMDVI